LGKKIWNQTLFNKYPLQLPIKNREKKALVKNKIDVYGKSLPRLFNKHVDYGNIMPERKHSLKMIFTRFSETDNKIQDSVI